MPRNTFNTTARPCPTCFEDRLPTSSGNKTQSSSRAIKPSRSPNTKAHPPLSQNRCCGRWQRWPVCQWDCEQDTGSVFSRNRSKHHHIPTQLWEAMSHSWASTASQLEHTLDTMKLADRDFSSFLGGSNMTIGLGDQKLVHTVWLAEIEPERILGLDFLWQYNCQLGVSMWMWVLASKLEGNNTINTISNKLYNRGWCSFFKENYNFSSYTETKFIPWSRTWSLS